jgi:FKBP-type peptidyl-prolyl cis-trans isomerase FkpA
MTEVTRVPLQPIAKGSLTKLWIGIAAAVLLALVLALIALPEGVEVDTLSEGSGPVPAATDVVFVRYTGTLEDGTVFDQSQDIPLPVQGIFPEGNPLPLDRMVPGFAEGALQMQKGGTYRITIPARYAYGVEGRTDPQGNVVIPPNEDLTFQVELVDFMSMEDFERRLAALQQALQMGGPDGMMGAPEAQPEVEGGMVPPPAPIQ